MGAFVFEGFAKNLAFELAKRICGRYGELCGFASFASPRNSATDLPRSVQRVTYRTGYDTESAENVERQHFFENLRSGHGAGDTAFIAFERRNLRWPAAAVWITHNPNADPARNSPERLFVDTV